MEYGTIWLIFIFYCGNQIMNLSTLYVPHNIIFMLEYGSVNTLSSLKFSFYSQYLDNCKQFSPNL